MRLSLFLPVLGLILDASAQDDTTVLVGTGDTSSVTNTLNQVPVSDAPYISYSSTITRSTPTAVTTSEILSLFTGSTTTRTRTIGTTTILGFNGTPIPASNATNQTGSATTSQSRIVLEGGNRPTTLTGNGTANATTTLATPSPQPTNTRPCNNYVEFCYRSYANITEVGAHNSPFVRPGNAAANQQLEVITQLNDGIRMIQGQVHFVNGTPHFCHGSCDVLDSGPMVDYLKLVYDWVLDHPFDVITILLGNARKADQSYRSVSEYIPFLEETGLQDFAYVPPQIPMGKEDWPTLAQMILSGKRVVIFMDYEADQLAYPWVLDEFSQMWETPFDPVDRSFPCTVQRPPDLAEADAKNRLYLFNHNLNYEISLLGNSILVPQIPLLNVTNNVTGEGSLGVNTAQCDDMWGYPPKFLNVDYYNVGNGSVFEVAAMYNNVTYTRECCGLPVSAGIKIKGQLVALLSIVIATTMWIMV